MWVDTMEAPQAYRKGRAMFAGLMQNDYPLTVQHLLYRMSTVHHRSEVVTLYPEGVRRTSYGELAGRVARLAGGLRSLGVGAGDRVGTFCWNTQEHLEAYYAAPCMGAVLHTLNLRLHPDQLVYIINHARDRVILVDDSLVALLAPLVPRLRTVQHFVVVGPGEIDGLPGAVRYEDLLARQSDKFAWPVLDERSASSLCYTSGTTGNPEGCAVLAPFHGGVCVAGLPAGLVRAAGGGPGDAGVADVPRERLGPSVRGRAGRGLAGVAGAVPAG
jgi:fatty-acyl-CoA synthase